MCCNALGEQRNILVMSAERERGETSESKPVGEKKFKKLLKIIFWEYKNQGNVHLGVVPNCISRMLK